MPGHGVSVEHPDHGKTLTARFVAPVSVSREV
jgi:hypothetical protein